jgi:hypothetical protein
MRRRLQVATAFALTLAAVIAVAPPAAAGGTPTTISSFSWTDSDGATDYFDGNISSAVAKCEKHRDLALYRLESGRDPKVAGGTTRGDGSFVIEHEDPGSGRYYLKVRRKHAGGTSCKSAETGTLKVTDLEGV